MIHPKVKKLYIYEPPDCYTKNILREKCLWAAKSESFNDPFDCDLEIEKPYMTPKAILKEMRKRGRCKNDIDHYKALNLDNKGEFIPKEKKRIDDIIECFLEENKNLGIVCMSERCDSILMWSHYAKSHTGVCFEFIRTEENNLGDSDVCSPVSYKKNYPKINLAEILLRQDGTAMRLLMRTKSIEWSYEKEWRYMHEHGNNKCQFPGPISRVIFGIKIKDDFKSCIEKLCNEHKIPCVQARKANRKYRIEVPPK